MYSLFLALNPELFASLFLSNAASSRIAVCVVHWDPPGAQGPWDSAVLPWACSLQVPSCAPQAAFSAPKKSWVKSEIFPSPAAFSMVCQEELLRAQRAVHELAFLKMPNIKSSGSQSSNFTGIWLKKGTGFGQSL